MPAEEGFRVCILMIDKKLRWPKYLTYCKPNLIGHFFKFSEIFHNRTDFFTAIFIWHFYAVIFKPGVYPMNWAWLTEKAKKEEVEIEQETEGKKD